MVELSKLESPTITKQKEQFETFITIIKASGIDASTLPFIKLSNEWKTPVFPGELTINKQINPQAKLDIQTARGAISSGFNVGVYASPEGLQFIDIDVEDGALKISEDTLEEMIKDIDTFTVKTRSGGYHLYFKNDGGTENKIVYLDGKTNIGELRRNWQYVLIPGSYIPKDKKNPSNGKSKGCTPTADGLYSVFRNSPIKDFDINILPPFLSFNKEKVEPQQRVMNTTCTGNDDDIIKRARSAKNSIKFSMLFYDGDASQYQSRSEADLALANIFAFYTEDVGQIKRMMRKSALSTNEKYSREDYLDTTIDKAIRDKKAYIQKNTQPCETKHIQEITEDDLQKIKDDHTKIFGELPELPEGFFRDYMEYGKRMSYAYPAYHLAGALTLVSLICGRRIAIKSTASTIYGNIFAMCIGPTSISGKSTANDFVNDFFTLVRQEGTIDELPKKLSPQGLLQRLNKIPCRLWAYDECSEFFTDSQSHWGEALESNLCSLYDSRSVGYGLSIKKKEDSEWMIKNAYVTCLWNTTSSGIEQHIQERSVSSGLVPRFMWFWMHGTNGVRKNRDFNKDDIQEKLKLQREMGDLQKILKDRPINDTSITFGISEILEDWLIEDLQTHMSSDDELHRVCSARLVPQAYKIAMLFAVMDTELQEYIASKKPSEPIHIKIPDKYALIAKDIAENYLRPRLEHVINLAKYNDGKNFQDMIRKSISNHKGAATKSQIIRDTRIQSRQLEEALQTMEEGEIIEQIIVESKVGRKAFAYKLI